MPVKKKAKKVKHESSSEDEVQELWIDPDQVFVTTTNASHQGKYHIREDCHGLRTAKSVYKREACTFCCNTAAKKIEEKDD